MLLPTKRRSRFETLKTLLKILLTRTTKATTRSCANSIPKVKYNSGRPIDLCGKTMEKYPEKPSPWMMPKKAASTKNGKEGLRSKLLFQYKVCRAVSTIVIGIKNSIQLEEKRIIPADAAQRDKVWPMVNAVTSKSNNRNCLKTNGSDMATKNSKWS